MVEQEKKPWQSCRKRTTDSETEPDNQDQSQHTRVKLSDWRKTRLMWEHWATLQDSANHWRVLKTTLKKHNKMPGNIVKAIQQMKRPTLDYPDKPVKNKCVDGQGTFLKTNVWTAKEPLTKIYSVWQSSRGRKITRLWGWGNTNIIRMNWMHGRLFMVYAHPSWKTS